MRQELQNIEYIERYLEGSLSPEDRHKFEQHLQEDPQFQKAVELQRSVVAQLKEEAFIADFSAYHEQMSQVQPAASKWRWMLLGFTILLLLGGIVYWQYGGTTPDPITEQQEMASEFDDELQAAANAPIRQMTPKETLPLASPLIPSKVMRKRVKIGRKNTINLGNGRAVLYIPTAALVDMNGQSVRGYVDLEYKEFRDQAAIACSGLPMSYQDGNSPRYQFNSVGMFEIKASKDGQHLFVAPNKSLKIDYEITNRMPNLGFYQFDDVNQKWHLLNDAIELMDPNSYTEVFDEEQYEEALEAYEADQVKETSNELFVRKGKEIEVGQVALMPENAPKKEPLPKPEKEQFFIRHKNNPKLVQGLELPSFGVYNCSQRYQVANQVAVKASYTNLQLEPIENGRILSVIDMNYNAAYSFAPDQFLCNSKANNVLLLWTEDHALYAFFKEADMELASGNYSFKMQNFSQEIQRVEDLREFLEFIERKIELKETTTM